MLRDALSAQGGSPLEVWDAETQKTYVVTEQMTTPGLNDNYIRQCLDEAAADVARGHVGPWNLEEIKGLGRQLLAE